MDTVANVVPITVVSRLVGWQDEDPDELFRAAIDSSAVLGATRSLDDAHAAMERIAAVGVWIAEQLDGALAQGADGLLGILARLEACLVLTRLLEMTEHLQLDPEQPPRLDPSLIVRRLTSLPLHWDRS